MAEHVKVDLFQPWILKSSRYPSPLFVEVVTHAMRVGFIYQVAFFGQIVNHRDCLRRHFDDSSA